MPRYEKLLFVINAATDIPRGPIMRENRFLSGVLIAALLFLILTPDIVLSLPRAFGSLCFTLIAPPAEQEKLP